jgi:hypothetical protein
MKKFILNKSYLLLGIVISAALLKPTDAAAHLVTTGMGPVYDGIGHLLLTPEDLVPALAVALYAGLRGRAPGRRALFFFPLAWLLGGFIGLTASTMPTFPVAAISFLLLGILIAADLRLSGIMSALFVLVALVSAFVVSLKPPWTRIVVRVAGSWVAAMGLLMVGWFFRGQM